ncbi:MAG TPA: class I SAM-dependent methyltransferase [Caulobacteraceae bacterium]|nr:class I SAM-dependent methyltransferase [Caulobacteraceae bacterium]
MGGASIIILSDSRDALSPAEDVWQAFHRRWPRLRPPLRPNADIVDAIGRQIDGHDARVLQLGVTPELASLGRDLTAVDWSEEMLARVWPGDRADRRAILADWRTMPDFPHPFTAATGDGSLNALVWPHDVRAVLASVAERLAPGGRIAIRCYLSPNAAETLEALAADVLTGGEPSPHAFKWRLAMALCAARGDANVALDAIWRALDEIFPDRAALAAASGWSPDDVGDFDAYRGSPATYCFPTAAQMAAVAAQAVSNVRFAASGSYPLAERCPILVAEAGG